MLCCVVFLLTVREQRGEFVVSLRSNFQIPYAYYYFQGFIDISTLHLRCNASFAQWPLSIKRIFVAAFLSAICRSIRSLIRSLTYILGVLFTVSFTIAGFKSNLPWRLRRSPYHVPLSFSLSCTSTIFLTSRSSSLCVMLKITLFRFCPSFNVAQHGQNNARLPRLQSDLYKQGANVGVTGQTLYCCDLTQNFLLFAFKMSQQIPLFA